MRLFLEKYEGGEYAERSRGGGSGNGRHGDGAVTERGRCGGNGNRRDGELVTRGLRSTAGGEGSVATGTMTSNVSVARAATEEDVVGEAPAEEDRAMERLSAAVEEVSTGGEIM